MSSGAHNEGTTAIASTSTESDGEQISMNSSGNEYLYVDAEGNASAFTPQTDPKDPLIQYTFSNDNRLLAAGVNGTIYQLDVGTGAVVQTWETQNTLMRISLAGDKLLSLIHIWNMRTGSM